MDARALTEELAAMENQTDVVIAEARVAHGCGDRHKARELLSQAYRMMELEDLVAESLRESVQ